MGGDHGREEYDEVAAMKQFAIDEGVPSEDVFKDRATCIFKPEPTPPGDAIPIFGDGNLANDETTNLS